MSINRTYHICSNRPKDNPLTEIEKYDNSEKWYLYDGDCMNEILYCPFCGVNLTEDKILKKCKSCNGNWESFQMSSEDECISCHLSKIDGSYMTS